MYLFLDCSEIRSKDTVYLLLGNLVDPSERLLGRAVRQIRPKETAYLLLGSKADPPERLLGHAVRQIRPKETAYLLLGTEEANLISQLHASGARCEKWRTAEAESRPSSAIEARALHKSSMKRVS